MKHLRNIALLSTLTCMAPVFGAFEDGLVPVDVVRVLSGGEVLSSLPADFPLAPLPAGHGLRLRGALDRGMVRDLVIEGSGSAEAALDVLREAYLDAGWLDLATTANTAQLCNDQHGRLTIRVASGLVHALWQTPSITPPGYLAGFGSCADQQADPGGLGTPLLGLIPVLELPSDAVAIGWQGGIFPGTSRMFRGFISGTASGGSHAEVEQGSLIDAPDTDSAALYSHFRTQLLAQGWEVDSQGSSAGSATSVWRRTLAPGDPGGMEGRTLKLRALFTILHEGESQYDILLRMRVEGMTGPETGLLGAPALGIRGVPAGYSEPYNSQLIGVYPVQPFVSGP